MMVDKAAWKHKSFIQVSGICYMEDAECLQCFILQLNTEKLILTLDDHITLPVQSGHME